MQVATGRLWNNQAYGKLFSQAYPQKERKAVDTIEVMNALASYVRSNGALPPRYMRWRRR